MTFVGSAPFNAIVNGAKYLQQYQAGNFVVRTFQGAGNILSGASQYLIGQAFKCSNDHQYNTVQSKLHIERGIRVFRQGVYEFTPGAAVATLAFFGGRAILRAQDS